MRKPRARRVQVEDAVYTVLKGHRADEIIDLVAFVKTVRVLVPAASQHQIGKVVRAMRNELLRAKRARGGLHRIPTRFVRTTS